MTVTAQQIRAWSEGICTLERARPHEVAALLGWSAEGLSVTRSWVAPACAPAGTRSMKFSLRDGLLDYVSIELAPNGGPTRTELDALLEEAPRPPLIAGLPVQVAYRVTRPGAGFTCAVFAGLDRVTPDHLVGLTLRRDRAV